MACWQAICTYKFRDNKQEVPNKTPGGLSPYTDTEFTLALWLQGHIKGNVQVTEIFLETRYVQERKQYHNNLNYEPSTNDLLFTTFSTRLLRKAEHVSGMLFTNLHNCCHSHKMSRVKLAIYQQIIFRFLLFLEIHFFFKNIMLQETKLCYTVIDIQQVSNRLVMHLLTTEILH